MNFLVQYVPFSIRTVVYGTISLTLGPFTRDHRASVWAMRRWSIENARWLRIGVEVDGQEHVPTDGPFVYCSNHQSHMDILALGAGLPGDFKWAAKRELLAIPFLGWHLRLAGHVPVERKRGPQAAAEVISRFVDVLRRGKALLIFPEGTRSTDGKLKPFKNGGFLAAVRAGAPVVPVALDGTYGVLPRGKITVPIGVSPRIRVRIGAPILPRREGDEAARVEDLRRRCQAAVADLLAGLEAERRASGEVSRAARGLDAQARAH
ncbi:MAG: 1-acyl-sn-glycerol-3-phosphate acyltransferase [Myxococcales bacterium]|jgi:1-acyl-sn-glycerol-3-phosphate acyltransferase|nr:1-acyl-sn-glycerol-3-phosphate acyltransferase [Myxococcales bacterium]MBL0192678.1 1-acyl-sn-glycerol-3-phosphate acyltransferase [Myxococcales bacterium]